MAQSIDDFAASFGVTKKRKPTGLRAPVQTRAEQAVVKKKKVDKRNLRQKIRDRRKMLDEL
jgi:hypothetical protein